MPRQNDVFAKMDALMKKHHPGAVQPLPVNVRTTADIPVLTDIVAEAEPEIPVLTEMADAPAGEAPGEPVISVPLNGEATSTPSPLKGEAAFDSSPFKGEAGRGMGLQDTEITESLNPIPTLALPLSRRGRREAAGTRRRYSLRVTGREHAPEALELAVIPLAEKGLEEGENSMHYPSPLPSPARGEGGDLEPDETEPAPPEPPPQAVEDQLPAELEDRIREQLVEQLAPQLAAALEKSLAGALDQFAMQIECLIRDAIAAEVRQQLAALQADKTSASARKTAD